MGNTQIVQTAGNLHDLVRTPRLGEAQLLFDDAAPLDPGNDVLDYHAPAGQHLVEQLVPHAQRLSLRLFLGCAVSTPAGS